MIDILCVRDAFNVRTLAYVANMLSERNLADSFTKVKAGIMNTICETWIVEPHVEQWIRKKEKEETRLQQNKDRKDN